MNQRQLGDLTILNIVNEHAQASISLYGCHVLSFKPKGYGEVLWLSPDAVFESGSAIRGGIPVCWPWFGKREEGGPNHGFARTRQWNLDTQETLPTGETRLVLSLIDCQHPEWSGKASLVSEIVIGQSLKVGLTTKNEGETPLSISQALHSYFTVGDVEKIRIKGLSDVQYIDDTNDRKLCVQSGDVVLKGEVDRVYLDRTESCLIVDPVLNRAISVKKSGSNATVVWNPGQALASQMKDFPEYAVHAMVCLETATAADFPLAIETGQSHTMTAWISIE